MRYHSVSQTDEMSVTAVVKLRPATIWQKTAAVEMKDYSVDLNQES